MDAPPPFLPEPEPLTPAKPPQKSGIKTLALWVVLILMFLAIWQFLAPDPNSAHPPAPPCEPGPMWTRVLPYAICFGLVALLYRWFWRTYQVSLDFNVAQEPGRIALAERRFAAA
jgi:hypothetical protein